MRRLSSLLVAAFLCFFCVSVASAGEITYQVTVDTSSVSGTVGSFDFQFNPGPFISQSASLDILGFGGNGSLVGAPTLTGNVVGALPGIVTFQNSTAFNDYFQGFTYGSSLTFDVHLYGSALCCPNGNSNSGSTFAFSMFGDSAGTMPVLTTDATDGFAFLINVNTDGTTTVLNYSSESTVVSESIPEPNAMGVEFVGLSIALVTLRISRYVGG